MHMNHWVETPYGRRYKEEHGTSIALFMTAPDDNGNRVLPEEIMDIILEECMNQDLWRDDE